MRGPTFGRSRDRNYPCQPQAFNAYNIREGYFPWIALQAPCTFRLLQGPQSLTADHTAHRIPQATDTHMTSPTGAFSKLSGSHGSQPWTGRRPGHWRTSNAGLPIFFSMNDSEC